MTEELSRILEQAKSRARQNELPYAGTLTPAEAFAVWRSLPRAKLVDTRTRAEWDWVGRIPGATEIEWQSYPGGQPNTAFLAELAQHADPETPLLFICRSGVRSHHAASLATEAGFAECYNVLEGFEGNVDANGQRGNTGGWRHAGLPWSS